MKKLILLMITLTLLTGCQSKEKITFEDRHYNTTDNLVEIDQKKLQELEQNKENYAVFVYLPNCTTSYNFNKLLTSFLEEYHMSFYKISSTQVKDTQIEKKVTYFPTLAIYKSGKIIAYLDSNSDEDLKYFEDQKEFSSWLNQYVTYDYIANSNRTQDENYQNTSEDNSNNQNNVTNNTQSNQNTSDYPETNSPSVINKYSKVEDIIFDSHKVNIYFFWGDGCPHCKEEFAFLESIYEEYHDYFNLYAFEVWYHEENANLLKALANLSHKEVKGVPFTIIGSQIIEGFDHSMEDDIKKAIIDEASTDNKIDYYKQYLNN